MHRGDTITFMFPEDRAVTSYSGRILIGVVAEQEESRDDGFEAYAAAATSIVEGGIRNAVIYLNRLRGLPDGTSARLNTYS
jgi:hypothetical protein